MSGVLSFFAMLLSSAGLNKQEVLRAQFGPIGWPEIIIIALIIMLLFGARKLPEIGRGLGKAIANFKRSVKEEPPKIEEGDNESETDEEEKKEESKKK